MGIPHCVAGGRLNHPEGRLCAANPDGVSQARQRDSSYAQRFFAQAELDRKVKS